MLLSALVDFSRLFRFGRGRRATAAMDAAPAAGRFSADIPQELIDLMTGQGAIAQRISRGEALQVPAVLRARNLIAGTLSTLPLKLIRTSDKSNVPWTLFEQPDPDVPTSVIFAYTFEDLLFEGIAWWRVLEYDFRGFPKHATWVDPNRVTVAGGMAWRSENQVSRDQLIPSSGTVFIDGIPVGDREVIRFDSPNPPLLRHAARAIRTALRLDRTASMYADEPMPLGYFEKPEGSDPLSEEEIENLLNQWTEARRRRAWGYVGGLRPGTLAFNAEQIQLAEQRQHAVLEIARAAGVDPEDLGVSTTSRTYANSEQRRQDLLDFTLGAYVSAFQDRLSMRDVSPRGHVARMQFAGFLRSDTLTRMNTYKIGLEVGAYTEDEIRDLEDRPRLTPEQRRALAERRGTAQQSIESGGAGSMSRDEPTDRPRLAVVGGTARFQATVTGERITFDAPECHAAFRVNADKRTVSGLLVPWGKIARTGFAKWRFAEGSIHWSEISRIKLNLHHDREQLVGVAVRLQSTTKGLDGTFKIARGPEGDRALSLADDRVLDGFSVEIEFEDFDEWQIDPTDETVRLVRAATLKGVALTGNPAFDDARLTSVKATRDDRSRDMPDEPGKGGGGQTATLDAVASLEAFTSGLAEKIAASHESATAGLADKIGTAVADGIKVALENIHDPQRDGPEPVRAARFQVTREAPVYTFDGRGPSIVRDAWYAQREHDDEAKERLRRFAQQSAEIQKLVASHVAFAAMRRISGLEFATVSTATASEVIPPGYRPDLFVPQLDQGRPIVNALSRGTISNATPFVVPVFASASGMTGDHVEGNPPTEGTLGLDTKTVTPTAISGKLPLTREIVDSSNPAIDQIALAAMREDYARQTEAKAYAVLNGSDGQGGTITNGFVPSGAQAAEVTDPDSGSLGGAVLLSAVRAQMALYPFRRFAAPTIGLLSQEGTVAFADAKDTTGRPLLPSIGAQNSAGMGNAVTQGWFVDGLPFVPAWSFTGNGAGDADAMILNSADAWAWESPVLAFRFEEKSGPQIIELALFGYFAVHLLRPVGLSAVRLTLTP